MIQITPSILTSNLTDFQNQLDKISIFNSIDIDIIRRDYTENETLDLSTILQFPGLFNIGDIGFHFMVKNSINDLQILSLSQLRNRTLRLYFQSDSEITEINLSQYSPLWKRCISISIDQNINNISFLSLFDEIQFMTVKVGFQGGQFVYDVLNKIDRLREMGYDKMVSIDGGVNLETAKEIRKHNINRVSVGSYFSKAINLEQAYFDLNNILNANN